VTVTVGGIAFDGATGTPTPPLSAAQLTAFAAAAEAYRYNGTAPTGEGSLDAWADLDEADAQERLRAAGGLIGYVVTVAYPHGSIAGVAVADVAGEWQARRGTVNGGVLLVRFRFDRRADRNDSALSRTLVFCQTAPALAGPWTTETGWASLAGSDGLGTYAGECSAVVANVGPDTSKLGLWVRTVLIGEDPDTTPSAIRWVGVVAGVRSSARRDPAQGVGWGAETVYRFAGLAHVLDRLHPTAWMEDVDTSLSSVMTFQGATGTAGDFADIGEPPPYNAEGKPNRGVTDVQLDAAPAPEVKLHARGLGTGAGIWSALEAGRNAIAQVRRSWPSLPRIVLDEPVPLSPILDYVGTWDVARKSLLGMLAVILAPVHKRTFRLSVDWAFSPDPAIVVTPVDLSATGTAIDLTGEEIADWTCDFDASTQLDAWYLDAGQRAYLQTVEFVWGSTTVGGVRAWSAAEETAWDTASTAERESLKLAHVARRFVLEPVWAGTGYLGGDAIPYTRQVDGGTGEETGELAAATDYPSALLGWKLDHSLPLGEGQDWAAAYPGPELPSGSPVAGPLVFYRKSGSPLEAVHTQLQVAVLDDAAGIEVGRNAAEALTIQAKMEASGYVLVATLSFLHPLSWRVSALETAPRTDAPRVGFTYLPSDAFRRVDAMASAVVGTTSAGAAVHATAGRRDGDGSLTALREQFREWYTSPDGSAEWRRRDVAVLTPDPGTMVASVTVTVATGPPLVQPTVAVGSPVARRVQSWDLLAPGVTWSASRIVPDLSGDGGGAVVAAGRGAVALQRPSDWNAGKRNA